MAQLVKALRYKQKVAGSIPNGVIGIFHWHNPSDRIMALGLTQPLADMSTRNIAWGVKAAGAQCWQSYHLHVPIVLKSWRLSFLAPSGPAQARNGIALLLHKWYLFTKKMWIKLFCFPLSQPRVWRHTFYILDEYFNRWYVFFFHIRNMHLDIIKVLFTRQLMH